MKFLVERTCFMLLAIADTISAMELINKGIPPFCRIIYETGLAHRDNCNRFCLLLSKT